MTNHDRRRRALAAALLLLGPASAALAGEAPVAATPGEASELARIGDACPTFSWGAIEGASGYELIVYRLGEDSNEPRPVVRRALAGRLQSWTPALRECLEPGERYAWSVRGVVGEEAGPWSAPSLFEVALVSGAGAALPASHPAAPDGSDTGAQRAAPSSAPAAASPSAADPEPSSTVEPTPPATTLLDVDGNVAATTFTGDGSNLSGVATDSELTAHAGDSSAHHVRYSDAEAVSAVGPHTVDTDTSAATLCATGEYLEGDGSCDSELPPGGAAGGDLTGTYPNPTIASGAVGAEEIADTARSINLPISALVNCDRTNAGPIAFSEPGDTAPEFLVLADGRLALLWEPDLSEVDPVCTSFSIPADYSADGEILLVSIGGSSQDNDWAGATVRQGNGAAEDTTPASLSGGTDCDAAVTPGNAYLCKLTVAEELLPGVGITVSIHRAGGSDNLLLYSMSFEYTAEQ
ncbi:MAG: hypothetical protein R3325_03240 [Thermoanaerobaculia bacterium]|nr:hypothetical protein [Thermoanaerobaculia bacterium]